MAADSPDVQMSFTWIPTTPAKTQHLICGPNDPTENTKWQASNFEKWKQSQLAKPRIPTGVSSAPLDLNSPRSTDADLCNLTSLQFKPVTPRKNKYLQKKSTKGDRVLELHRNKEMSNQVMEKNQKPDKEDVDFIRTPRQIPRRRKHRPRVVIESHKKSISKSHETAKVKRKCVRTKGATNPSVGEINGIGLNNKEVSSTHDPTQVAAPRRSCRKSLNFNSDYQAGGKSSSCSMIQPQQNIPTMDNIKLVRNQTLHTRGKCQIVFTNVTHDEETNSVQPRMNQTRTKSLDCPICSSACLTPEKQVTGLKRQNMSTSVESEICNRNEVETHNNFMYACLVILSQSEDRNNTSPGFYCPTSCKKQRTKKGHDMVASSSRQTGATLENHVRRGIHSLRGSFTSQIESVKNQEFDSGQCQVTDLPRTNSEIDGTQNGRKIRKRKSKGPTELRDLASKLKVCGRLPASTSKVVTTSSLRPNISVLHEAPTCMEALAANTNTTWATKKRSMRRILKNSAVPNLYNRQKSCTTSKGLPLASTSTYMSTVDSIVEKHSQLDLEQHALVPYQRSGVVVPFDGSFDKVRRRIPRPQVDLNEETTRVWGLLLENINSEGIDGTNEEKKKWWEDERKVFNGRAGSFIARMHLVQGDRQFSQWKGSVLDSVVGVFLTQNVSDHLSSSAFMSMAARFPPKSKTQTFRLNNSNMNTFKNPERKEVNSSKYGPGNYRGTKTHDPKAKAGKSRKEEKQNDWDHMRKQTLIGGAERAKTADTNDSVDWDAVRCADVDEIARTIKGRGMNNRLAERIQKFLNRIFKDHGSIDLEWLRDVPPEKAKEYLLSIRGLGLKSVECLRLLTLHHLAFPVDTHVCRIAVRLGWVPLQPLPESLQLHLLELYPVLESIQKYLWPRLCKLDQKTLYELHYQMITFGKVFCTKQKPNCNACPMRGECRHFASAFASARLALPAPEEKGIIGATKNREVYPIPMRKNNTLQLPPPEVNQLIGKYEYSNSQPLIEEPPSPEPIYEVAATPEQVYAEVSQCDIENAFNGDPDEIPTIQLNMGEFAHNLQKIMQQNTELYASDMSKALVALTSEAASIPAPKLKNVNRLRTEHQVYELPDSHYLLEGMDKREPDDPCPYLLAIWIPGETENSSEPPERQCNSHEFEKLCTNETCSSCNGIRETDSQTVRGTILIPCRTAMRGSFPLNGTYFQVNEVFSDHQSSMSPIDVPRQWLWNLQRRTVYFGTSIPTIFRGMTTEGIQYCFWRGFVCVRGFERKTRAPRPLIARLHCPESRLAKGKGKADEN